MKRRTSARGAKAIWYALAGALLATCLFSIQPARADVEVQINIGNAPPPPRFVFESRPHERFYRGEGVYVVDDPRIGDYDVFRYRGYYWVFYDGYWYRARYWRGPFVVIHPRYVPTTFYRMPPTRWKHHPAGPPRYDRQDRQDRGNPPGHMPPGRATPPVRVPPGSGNPPGHMQPDRGNPPGHMQLGRENPPPPAHVQPGRGTAPGHDQKGNTPPGQKKKGEKGNDKGNDKGTDKGGHGEQ
jgi:hypothetical protein